MLALLKIFTLFALILTIQCCVREPSPYHSRVPKLTGDNGFQIKIHGNPEKYQPGNVYTCKLSFRRYTVKIPSRNSNF